MSDSNQFRRTAWCHTIATLAAVNCLHGFERRELQAAPSADTSAHDDTIAGRSRLLHGFDALTESSARFSGPCSGENCRDRCSD